MGILKILETHFDVKKARDALILLKKMEIIGLEDEKELGKKIDQVARENSVFVTKPFRISEFEGIHLYRMMKAVQRNLEKILNENPTT